MKRGEIVSENKTTVTKAVGKANIEVVADMATFLMDAVNAYRSKADEKDGLAYIDSMMALHNLHVAILIDLVDRTGNYYWLIAARDTFEMRINNEIAKHRK